MNKSYPRSFSHIGITVPDLKKAVEFYEEVMGWYVIMPPSKIKKEKETAIGQMCIDVFGEDWEEFEKLFGQSYSGELVIEHETKDVLDVFYQNPYAKWDWWVVGGRWRSMGDNGFFEDLSVFSETKQIPYWKEELASFKLHDIEQELGIDRDYEGYDELITDYIKNNKIPRFYDRSDGDISIDGQSIYEFNLFSLRKNISLVSQDTTLFDDTVKNNIKYAKLDASEDEILESAKNSFAHEFIEKLPNKYETLIGENGVRLSGGEKQRISIARAMLKKSPIILLDEATSSLDSETESKIQTAIKDLTKDKTSVVIAHRLSTILNANKIFVVDSGKILEHGTHDELLSSSETYKNFYNKQLKRN